MFKLENNVIKMDTNILNIPALKVLWDRDKTKDKDNAKKELSYVYYLADYHSPYQNIPEEMRSDKIREEFIKDKKWKEDKEVQEAIKIYMELQETATMRLLKSARIAVDRLADYFKESEPEDKNYTSNLEKLGKIIESINKLDQQVKKEQTDETRIRGGGELKYRER